MYIQHLRNATMLVETANAKIIIDPMLGQKGQAAPPFSFIRFKPRRNPIIDLPEHTESSLDDITHCLVTHLHPDHLDKTAESFLRSSDIPVICSIHDAKILESRGSKVAQTIDYWKPSNFLGAKIIGVPARHGYGSVAKRMGNVMGFYVLWPNEPSLYLSSDTIYTEDVHKVLSELKPDISVVACGSARLDLYKPILMHMQDILKFVKNAPGKVLANHMEALNHCPTKRQDLKRALEKLDLSDKVWIPDDGDGRIFN
jgi:L-ascorbate metabolism protein UlaG (beta-lactamase superfamily)